MAKTKPDSAAVPSAADDEYCLAGSLLCSPDVAHHELTGLGLTGACFARSECRQVFDAVERLALDNVPLDASAVLSACRLSADIASRLIEMACRLDAIRYHAIQVRDAHSKRLVMRALEAADGLTALRMVLEKGLAELPRPDGRPSSLNADEWLTQEPPAPDYIVEGLVEVKSRVMLIGASKAKKSFAALQLAVCVAAGLDFVGYVVPRPRRVLLVNFENPSQWQHRRFRFMAAALDIVSMEGRLDIMNARGKPVDLAAIEAEAQRHKAELILLDPAYKIPGAGEENDQEKRMALIARLDTLGERTGAAVLFTHHDPKGDSASRGIRDRGSGSNLINRDVDCTLTLDRWGKPDEPNAANLVVLDTLARNTKETPPRTLCFSRGAFVYDPDRRPCKAMQKSPYASRVPTGDPQEDARLLAKYAMDGDAKSMTELRNYGKAELGDQRTRRAIDELKSNDDEYGVTCWSDGKTRRGFIGCASAVMHKRQGVLPDAPA